MQLQKKTESYERVFFSFFFQLDFYLQNKSKKKMKVIVDDSDRCLIMMIMVLR